MCKFCEKVKSIEKYGDLISKMFEEDKDRIENSKIVARDLSAINSRICSSMKWPVKLVYPMFEARAAYAVPSNYFQRLTLDEEKLGNAFSHGAMRSIFFVGKSI